MKYKVNDLVRIVSPRTTSDRQVIPQGRRGRIYSVNSHTTAPYPYGVKLYVNGGAKFLNMAEDELEPVAAPILEHGRPAVDHPSHYTWLPNGVEVIDLTEHLNFCRGSAVKYLCRAGRKNAATELEDLQKARWYIDREIQRISKEQTK